MSEAPLPLAVITAAIIKTRKDVGTLGKAAVNPHGNYKYVSIDKYYEVVASAAAKNGLFWTISEIKSTLNPNIGKTGVLDASYTITMYHESGAVVYEFSRIGMVHPIQGAQTVGSAMSYVDKVFMRQIFAVSTGEEDADATNPDDIKLTKSDAFALDNPPKQVEKPAPAPKQSDFSKEDLAEIERLLTGTADMSLTVNELTQHWRDASKNLEILKAGDREAFARVFDFYANRKKQLKG